MPKMYFFSNTVGVIPVTFDFGSLTKSRSAILIWHISLFGALGYDKRKKIVSFAGLFTPFFSRFHA